MGELVLDMESLVNQARAERGLDPVDYHDAGSTANFDPRGNARGWAEKHLKRNQNTNPTNNSQNMASITSARMGTLRAIAQSSDRFNLDSVAPGSVVGFLKDTESGAVAVASGSAGLPGGIKQGALGSDAGGVIVTKHGGEWNFGPSSITSSSGTGGGDGAGGESHAVNTVEQATDSASDAVRRVIRIVRADGSQSNLGLVAVAVAGVAVVASLWG